MKLSVVIPNYNHAHFLPECIEALIKQTRPADEILIVDDSSTDSSCFVIQEYQKIHSQIRLIKNKKNKGPSYSINRGAQSATGQYLAICAADDFYLPSFFQELLKQAKEYPKAGLLCAGYYEFNHGKKPYTFIDKTYPAKEDVLYFTPEGFADYLRKTSFIIPSMTTLYKRELFLNYQFDEQMKSLCDFYLNYQIALRTPLVFVKKPLGAYRICQNSYGNKMRFAFRQRSKMYSYWLRKVIKEEDPYFKKAFFRSGLFSYGGKFMWLYLFFRPQFWYLYFHLLKKYYASHRRSSFVKQPVTQKSS